MESLFILLLDDVEISIKKNDTYDWVCGPGSHFIRFYSNT